MNFGINIQRILQIPLKVSKRLLFSDFKHTIKAHNSSLPHSTTPPSHCSQSASFRLENLSQERTSQQQNADPPKAPVKNSSKSLVSLKPSQKPTFVAPTPKHFDRKLSISQIKMAHQQLKKLEDRQNNVTETETIEPLISEETTRYHEEGLVSQMRRIFETNSKDASTSTNLR